MQAPPLVTSQFAPGEASVSVKKAGGGACAATSERRADGRRPHSQRYISLDADLPFLRYTT